MIFSPPDFIKLFKVSKVNFSNVSLISFKKSDNFVKIPPFFSKQFQLLVNMEIKLVSKWSQQTWEFESNCSNFFFWSGGIQYRSTWMEFIRNLSFSLCITMQYCTVKISFFIFHQSVINFTDAICCTIGWISMHVILYSPWFYKARDSIHHVTASYRNINQQSYVNLLNM